MRGWSIPEWVWLLSALAILAAVLLWQFEIEWSKVILILAATVFAYRFVKELAQDVLKKWVYENVSPGVGMQRSIVFPRVWTFRPEWTKRFLEELSEPSMPQEPGADRLPASLAKVGSTSQLLSKLVIEEYATRIRVHRWLFPGSDEEDSERPCYEWFDIPHRPHWMFKAGSKSHKADELWAYSKNQMSSLLRLWGTWRKDSQNDRVFYQLTLRTDRPYSDKEEQSNAIFEVPLDPGLLDDQRGKTVLDDRWKDRKASEVLPYPLDEGSWEAESGKGDDWRWSWYLWMQTFDRGSWF